MYRRDYIQSFFSSSSKHLRGLRGSHGFVTRCQGALTKVLGRAGVWHWSPHSSILDLLKCLVLTLEQYIAVVQPALDKSVFLLLLSTKLGYDLHQLVCLVSRGITTSPVIWDAVTLSGPAINSLPSPAAHPLSNPSEHTPAHLQLVPARWYCANGAF